MKARILTVVSITMLSAMFLCATWSLVGCEPADGITGLTITPSSATVTPASNTVTFTVSGITNVLALPLEWSVVSPSLGTIVTFGGYSAVYQGYTTSGRNTIMVRDQYDNEAMATALHAPNATTTTTSAATTSTAAATTTTTSTTTTTTTTTAVATTTTTTTTTAAATTTTTTTTTSTTTTTLGPGG